MADLNVSEAALRRAHGAWNGTTNRAFYYID